MTKKYYRISDLINDYMKLKRENEKIKRDNLKNILSFWKMVSGKVENPENFKGISINKIIKGLEEQMDEVQFYHD